MSLGSSLSVRVAGIEGRSSIAETTRAGEWWNAGRSISASRATTGGQSSRAASSQKIDALFHYMLCTMSKHFLWNSITHLLA